MELIVVHVIPFPFTLVMLYDETGASHIISRLDDLKTYVRQNEDPEIKRRRNIRACLRALDVLSHLSLSDDRAKQFVFPYLTIGRRQVSSGSDLIVSMRP